MYITGLQSAIAMLTVGDNVRSQHGAAADMHEPRINLKFAAQVLSWRNMLTFLLSVSHRPMTCTLSGDACVYSLARLFSGHLQVYRMHQACDVPRWTNVRMAGNPQLISAIIVGRYIVSSVLSICQPSPFSDRRVLFAFIVCVCMLMCLPRFLITLLKMQLMLAVMF